MTAFKPPWQISQGRDLAQGQASILSRSIGYSDYCPTLFCLCEARAGTVLFESGHFLFLWIEKPSSKRLGCQSEKETKDSRAWMSWRQELRWAFFLSLAPSIHDCPSTFIFVSSFPRFNRAKSPLTISFPPGIDNESCPNFYSWEMRVRVETKRQRGNLHSGARFHQAGWNYQHTYLYVRNICKHCKKREKDNFSRFLVVPLFQ